ncbi:hypothetical protein [Microlunatus sp. GCM10028923]|uniref:hypothetical protein n=1 Tax=Microlunatus sp. GCM10028923 TaxID=3273400 RepID=UPI0036178898
MTDPRPLPEVPGPDDAVWRYHRHFCQVPAVGADLATFDIAVDRLDPCADQKVAGELGLTYDQVNAALDRIRAEEPHLYVTFSPRTAKLLSDKIGAEVPKEGWQLLTGAEIIDPPPPPSRTLPERPRSPGFQPPITDYGTGMF